MPGSYSLGLNFNRIYCDFTKSCSYLLGLKGQVILNGLVAPDVSDHLDAFATASCGLIKAC